MKGLYVFTVEQGDRPMDGRLPERIESEQKKRGALYHLHVTRIRLTNDYTERQDDNWEWLLAAGEDGSLLDPDSAEELIHRGATKVLAEAGGRGEDLLELVYIACDSRSAIAMINIASLMARRSAGMFNSRSHLIVMIDQLNAYRDRGVARLMGFLEKISGETPRFYTSLYLLPWEDDKRERTISVVDALTKAAVIGARNPMLTQPAGPHSPMWLETAALVRLEAPMARIKRIVFEYIADTFYTETLAPALNETGDYPHGLSARSDEKSREIIRQFAEEAGQLVLPPLTRLFEIMPVRNPKSDRKSDGNMLPDDAWQHIRALYADEQYDELHAMLDTDRDAIFARYGALQSETARQLVCAARDVAQEGRVNLRQFRLICQAMAKTVKEAKTRASAVMPEDEPEYPRFTLFDRGETRDARAVARFRQACLKAVYRAAVESYRTDHRDARNAALTGAAGAADQYLRDFSSSLISAFEQARDRQLAGMARENIYDYRLKEAYEAWCAGRREEITIPPSAMYEAMSDAPENLKPGEAAAFVSDRLIDRCWKAAEAAVESIRSSIRSFFGEISFRADELRRHGHGDVNMNGELLEYLLAQSASPGLMVSIGGETYLKKPAAQAFIFRESAQDGSGDFADLARGRNINVITDLYEGGVNMLVKYEGNFLDQTVVYRNNPQDDV